jgi:orotate phosphoribosyltransferase
VHHGEFTLASGHTASFYVDLRQVSLDHRVAPLIGDVMLGLVEEFEPVDAVGGLTMGADPVASAIMLRGLLRGKNYDAFVVRKEPKDHGRGRTIEGPDVRGKRVVVVEDTSTTGGSPLTAARAVEEAGGEVVAVCVVVDRNTGADRVIEEAGYPYRAAVRLDDLGLVND